MLKKYHITNENLFLENYDKKELEWEKASLSHVVETINVQGYNRKRINCNLYCKLTVVVSAGVTANRRDNVSSREGNVV